MNPSSNSLSYRGVMDGMCAAVIAFSPSREITMSLILLIVMGSLFLKTSLKSASGVVILSFFLSNLTGDPFV